MTTAATGWELALPDGTATGVGSLVGEDGPAAQRLVFDLLPDLPHLAELPDRGPGADLVGRGAVFLTDLPVDLQPAGWRFVPRPGRDLVRARDLLARDLDVLAEVADGWTGPLKLQAAGPWTLAATVELSRGDKALSDPGAVADLAGSLADGLTEHVAAVRRAVPGATLLVQLDEPVLPAVAAGHVPTASGFSALRTPEAHELREVLATVLAGLPAAGVHCCAAQVPVGLLRDAGASWVGLDATLLRTRDLDAIGEALEAGVRFMFGLTGDRPAGRPAEHSGEQPAQGPGARAADFAPALDLQRRLGIDPTRWLAATVVSPTCGRADAGTYRRVVEAGRRLAATVGA